MKNPQKNLNECTTTNEQHAQNHNKKVAVIETVAENFFEEQSKKPEFELRVLDNRTLTLICMALEKRTVLLEKNIKEIRDWE